MSSDWTVEIRHAAEDAVGGGDVDKGGCSAMTRKGRRLAILGTAGGVLALAVGLVLFALRDSIVFFYGPTEFTEKAPAPGTRLRIGGLVEKGSLVRTAGDRVTFTVTDLKTTVPVSYTGVLPDLFREGQGVVAEGVVAPTGGFAADTVLAKHDETYMPKEVADSLKKQGVWRGDEKAAGAAPRERVSQERSAAAPVQ